MTWIVMAFLIVVSYLATRRLTDVPGPIQNVLEQVLEAFTGMLEQQGVRISMDGKGRYSDNLFVERLWRTVKYEEVYLKAYQDGRDARVSLGNYFRFYNAERPHQALDYRTPAEVFTSTTVETTNGGMVESLTLGTMRTAGPNLNLAPILSQ